jgi:hypothetical protein
MAAPSWSQTQTVHTPVSLLPWLQLLPLAMLTFSESSFRCLECHCNIATCLVVSFTGKVVEQVAVMAKKILLEKLPSFGSCVRSTGASVRANHSRSYSVCVCVCACVRFIRCPLASGDMQVPAIYPLCLSMYRKPLLSDEFRASSRPVVAFLPGVPFSGPVARGSETFLMPLRSLVLHPRCYYLAYHPSYLPYLGSILRACPRCY